MRCGPEELNRQNDLLKSLELGSQSRTVHNQFLPELEDPLRHMGTWLNDKDHVSFSLSCHQIIQWSKQEVKRRVASCLLERVVQGNQEAARHMLQSNPGLLLSTVGTTIDYSGKFIQGLTAFQAALCAGDVEMCAMMKDYFGTLENGDCHLKQQFDFIFPQGIEVHSQEQAKVSFDFTGILDAILQASENEVLTALKNKYLDASPLHMALRLFRNTFDTLSYHQLVFNPMHLNNALDVFDEHFDTLRSRHKRAAFWTLVVGYTQRHLPACYAQDCAQGIHFIIELKHPRLRTFDFRLGEGAIFPISLGSGLGFDFAAVYPWRAAEIDAIAMPRLRAGMSSYISNKNIELGEISSCPIKRASSWCVVS